MDRRQFLIAGSSLAAAMPSADPARAQRVLATIIDVYVEQNLEFAQASTTSAVDWLRLQLDKLRDELEASERALHKYKKDKNTREAAAGSRAKERTRKDQDRGPDPFAGSGAAREPVDPTAAATVRRVHSRAGWVHGGREGKQPP